MDSEVYFDCVDTQTDNEIYWDACEYQADDLNAHSPVDSAQSLSFMEAKMVSIEATEHLEPAQCSMEAKTAPKQETLFFPRGYVKPQPLKKTKGSEAQKLIEEGERLLLEYMGPEIGKISVDIPGCSNTGVAEFLWKEKIRQQAEYIKKLQSWAQDQMDLDSWKNVTRTKLRDLTRETYNAVCKLEIYRAAPYKNGFLDILLKMCKQDKKDWIFKIRNQISQRRSECSKCKHVLPQPPKLSTIDQLKMDIRIAEKRLAQVKKAIHSL